MKSSSVKCTEHSEEVFPGTQFFLLSRTKFTHRFRLLCFIGHVSPKKGIRWRLMLFSGSLTLSQRAATHLSGILTKYRPGWSKIPTCFQVRKVTTHITCSWTYVTSHFKPRKTGANSGPKWRQIRMSLKNYKKIAFYPTRKIFSQKFIRWNVELDERKKFFDVMGTLRSVGHIG